MILIFIGPSIVIYFYSITNKITCYHKLFILVKLSTCFGGFSIHHQERKTAYTATVYVKQLLLPVAIGDGMELVLRS
jgi:hypothetical protein